MLVFSPCTEYSPFFCSHPFFFPLPHRPTSRRLVLLFLPFRSFFPPSHPSLASKIFFINCYETGVPTMKLCTSFACFRGFCSGTISPLTRTIVLFLSFLKGSNTSSQASNVTIHEIPPFNLLCQYYSPFLTFLSFLPPSEDRMLHDKSAIPPTSRPFRLKPW